MEAELHFKCINFRSQIEVKAEMMQKLHVLEVGGSQLALPPTLGPGTPGSGAC